MIDPGWWVVIAAAILGVFGAIIAAIIKRSDIMFSRGGNGNPNPINKSSIHMIPGLADVCKVEAKKLGDLHATCISLEGKFERLDEKVVETRQVIDSMKSDIDLGFKSIKQEIRNGRSGTAEMEG